MKECGNYQTSRSGDRPAEFLRDFNGYLHADGWDEYHRKLPDRILAPGCRAHCRRKFDDTLKALPEQKNTDALLLGYRVSTLDAYGFPGTIIVF